MEKKSKLDELIDWAFKAVITGCIGMGVSVLRNVGSSVDRLNEKMAQVVVTSKWHEKEIGRHEEWLNRLENICRDKEGRH